MRGGKSASRRLSEYLFLPSISRTEVFTIGFATLAFWHQEWATFLIVVMLGAIVQTIAEKNL